VANDTVVVDEEDIYVVTDSDIEQVVTAQDEIVVVSEAEQGPKGAKGEKGDSIKGDKGDPGLSGANYVHDQLVSAADWEINHNLNRYPSVVIVDSAGTVVEGSVEYVSSDVIRLHFAAPFGGKSFLN